MLIEKKKTRQQNNSDCALDGTVLFCDIIARSLGWVCTPSEVVGDCIHLLGSGIIGLSYQICLMRLQTLYHLSSILYPNPKNSIDFMKKDYMEVQLGGGGVLVR